MVQNTVTIASGIMNWKFIFGVRVQCGMARFAGVLPYAKDASGTVYVLLAQERFGRDAGKWSGFAGGPNAHDSDAVATACREAFEESCGLLGDLYTLRCLLQNRTASYSTTVPGGGVHFLLPMQFVGYLPRMFAGAQELLASVLPPGYSPYLEKQAVAWFPVDDVEELCSQDKLRLRAGFLADWPLLLSKIKEISS